MYRPFQNLEIKPVFTQYDFDCLYDKYGSAIYGVLLKLTGNETTLAEFLLKEVFVEVFLNKDFNYETDQPSFTHLLRIVIKVTGMHGFPSAAISKIILTPATSRYN